MQVVDAIITLLRIPEERHIKSSIDRLVTLNQEVTGSPVPGFLYRGIAYRHSSTPKGKLSYPALDVSLFDEADAHLTNVRRVDDEMQRIKQSLLALTRGCTDQQDLRDALPECLIQALDTSLKSLPRSRPPAWNLDPDGREYRQYLKILPKLEFFTAARLMY